MMEREDSLVLPPRIPGLVITENPLMNYLASFIDAAMSIVVRVHSIIVT